MPKRAGFSNPVLNLKIRKGEDVESRKRENFIALCLEYGMHAENFDQNDSTHWRLLCWKLMEHLVPGFQVNKSGNTRRHTLESDHEIYSAYGILQFTPVDRNGAKAMTRKARIQKIAKGMKLAEDQVRSAIQRYERLLRENPAAIFDPSVADTLPSYAIGEPSEDRFKHNRRKRNLGTK